jgi:hypothetical protein
MAQRVHRVIWSTYVSGLVTMRPVADP